MKAKTKKKLIIAGAIILGLALIYLIIFLLPRPHNFKESNPLLKDEDAMPILIAHRGGDGEFPGNTLEAFYNAYSVDERVIMETDVNLTKDGVLILCHDTTLDDTTNVKGEISDWNYTDLVGERINFGYDNDDDDSALELYKNENGDTVYPSSLENYPDGLAGRDKEVFLVTTLEELLTSFPNNVISVEIKQDGEVGKNALNEAVRIVKKHNAFDRVIFASFHSDIYSEVQRMIKEDEVPDNFMCSPSLGSNIVFFALHFLGLDVFYGGKVAVLQIPMEEYGFDLSTKALVERAHRHNIAVQYWTIDDVDEMRELIEIGADGIMTDYPHRLKQVYESMGK